jgi:uncharacterized protein
VAISVWHQDAGRLLRNDRGMDLHPSSCLKCVTALVTSVALVAAAAREEVQPSELDVQEGALAWLLGHHATAQRHFRAAAERGDPLGQYNLAMMLMNGDASAAQPQQAIAWLLKAANQGLPMAQHELGEQYAHGKHLAPSPMLAFLWHGRAAEQGWLASQVKLAEMHLHGHGTPHDRERALWWYSRAAEQGDVQAEEKVRELARSRLGV